MSHASIRRAVRGLLYMTLATLLWSVTYSASAQSTSGIDARQQQRQQEREDALRERLDTVPDIHLQPSPVERAGWLPESETPCFPIHRIELSGDGHTFDWALAKVIGGEDPALGRCLGTEGIGIGMSRVQNALVDRGLITTRVLAEAQDLSDGTLELTIIPGRIQSIRLADESGPGRRQLRSALPARAGDLLQLRDLEQALENLKGVPTADADFSIEPATGVDARPGESDVVVSYRQAFPLRLTLTLDDSGSKATGRLQAGALVSYDNPLRLNDVLYLDLGRNARGPGKRGTRNYGLHYSVPWGYWRAGLSASRYDYHQTVSGANQDYRYSGVSHNADARLERLLHRNAVSTTSASLRGWLRTSRNYIDDTEIEVQRRRMAGWEASLSHRRFIAAAVVDLRLGYRRGTSAFNAIRAPEEDFDEGTARPRITWANASVLAPFTLGNQHLRWKSTWRGQHPNTRLVPQDRFNIGGRYSVRGFDGERVLSGERGWLWRNDLGLALPGGNELYLGLDHGRVGGPSARWQPGRSLTGAVVGLRGSLHPLSYELFVGTPLRKPDGFKTAHGTAGFNLALSF